MKPSEKTAPDVSYIQPQELPGEQDVLVAPFVAVARRQFWRLWYGDERFHPPTFHDFPYHRPLDYLA